MRTAPPRDIIVITPKIRRRFESKFVKSDSDDCWKWTSRRDRWDYGRFRIEGKMWYAHRVSWLIYRGKITSPCVLHTCDNPPCVNPAHLFLGTNADNVKDMVCKGRQSILRGEDSPNARLTWDDVGVIRLLARMGDSGVELAKEFGVGETTIYLILNHKTWKLK